MSASASGPVPPVPPVPPARTASEQPVGAGEFADVDDVLTSFAQAGYLADRRLATMVFLQSRLGKPVLLEGPAGVGKTQLAATLAEITGRRLLRLQCYEGQDETKALYEWDYGKQLLYTQLLRDKIGDVIADAPTVAEAVRRIGEHDSVFFSETFLAARPLLEAVRSPVPAVLLVDEIDRADEALEAVLLEMLAEFQVSVPEIGTFRAVHQPYVILTSNTTRDLSAALKRRCLHLFIDYPDPDRELDIVRAKYTGLPEALARRLVTVVRQLRDLDLRKAPSISETVDWARTLAVLGVQELTAQVLADTATVVLKYQRDLHRALEVLPTLVDPNATVPDHAHGPDHGHDHAHGHNHGHAHGPDHAHAHHDDAPANTPADDAPANDAGPDHVQVHDHSGGRDHGGGNGYAPVTGQGGRACAAARARGRRSKGEDRPGCRGPCTASCG